MTKYELFILIDRLRALCCDLARHEDLHSEYMISCEMFHNALEMFNRIG